MNEPYELQKMENTPKYEKSVALLLMCINSPTLGSCSEINTAFVIIED
jgi:hypothetical protein